MKYKLFCLLVSAIVLVGVGCGGRSPERSYAGKYLMSEIFWNLEQDGTVKYYNFDTGRWVAFANWKEWKEGESKGVDFIDFYSDRPMRHEDLGQGVLFWNGDRSHPYMCCIERVERDSGTGYSGIYGLSREPISIKEDGTISYDDTVHGKWKVWEEDGKKGIEISPEGEEPFRLEDRGRGILGVEEPLSPTGYLYYFRIEPEIIGKTEQSKASAGDLRASCMNNVRSLVQMAHMYSIDNYEQFPSGFADLDAGGYTIGNLTSCPTAGANAYGFNIAACQLTSPGDTPLVGDFDSSNHNDEGGNIGYVDGSTRWHVGRYEVGSGPLRDVKPEDWVRK